MSPAEAEALRALRAALAVLHEYMPSCSLHRIGADEVQSAIGNDGAYSPLEVGGMYGAPTRTVNRLIYDTRLHIFTNKEPS